jgi:alpha-tubulin suppressor-like RCC1 family protein
MQGRHLRGRSVMHVPRSRLHGCLASTLALLGGATGFLSSCGGATNVTSDAGLPDAGGERSVLPDAPNLPAPVSLSLGSNHSCAVVEGGQVACWGDNSYRQLGVGQDAVRPVPALVPGLFSIFRVIAGGSTTCALMLEFGGASCWGNNTEGEVGNDKMGTQFIAPSGLMGLYVGMPTPVQNLVQPVDLSVGMDHVCAVSNNGSVSCWGSSLYQALGRPDAGDTAIPGLVMGASNEFEVAAGLHQSCAKDGAGAVSCWGDDQQNAVGDDGGAVIRQSPVVVPGVPSATQLAVGPTFSCALATDGTVWCWGADASPGPGVVGPDPTPPHPIPGISGALQLDVGRDHACVWLKDGSIACWGSNSHGQLGFGRVALNAGTGMPTRVPGLSGASGVATGDFHTCTIVANEVLCWGENDHGELGIGVVGADVPTPTKVLW